MKEWDRKRIICLLDECGKEALAFQGKAARELKKDHSVVTEADKSIERWLDQALAGNEPDVYLIGEESIDTHDAAYFERALKHTAWIIDPIDGTILYANQLPGWGISVGYAVNGKMKEGAILLPSTGELLSSDHGHTYYRPSFQAEEKELFPVLRQFSDAGVVFLSQKMTRRGGYRGTVGLLVAGCCVFPGMALAKGIGEGMVTHSKVWDVAGILPALSNLGFCSGSRSGSGLMGMSITQELFDLDPASEFPFVMHCDQVIAPNAEMCSRILEQSVFPGESF